MSLAIRPGEIHLSRPAEIQITGVSSANSPSHVPALRLGSRKLRRCRTCLGGDVSSGGRAPSALPHRFGNKRSAPERHCHRSSSSLVDGLMDGVFAQLPSCLHVVSLRPIDALLVGPRSPSAAAGASTRWLNRLSTGYMLWIC